MSLTISSQWVDFLESLLGKPNGQSLCFYQQNIDFLYVICGEGPCSDWDRLSIGKMIFAGVDIIEKMYPADFAPEDDSFAGIEIWGGVQDFLSYNYKFVLGDKYEKFCLQHNTFEWTTPVAEIIDFLVKDQRGLIKPAWSIWQDRVTRTLAKQQPAVHVPLI